MPVKITKDYKGLSNLVTQVQDAAAKAMVNNAEKIIVKENIELGLSPVEGEGKFEKYSDSYKQAIKDGRYKQKNISPVNLKLSGDLLDSFYAKKNGTGIVIGFKDKLADIHTNQGAGRSKVIRKMLPGDGEQFKASIFDKFIALIQAEVDRIVSKL